MINNKTATLLIVANSNNPKRFFVQTVGTNGEIFESSDYNLYPKQVKQVIEDYENRGYTIVNKLSQVKKVEFMEQPKIGLYGKWEMKKILILGGSGVGKTQLANLISKSIGVPVVEGVERLNELPSKEGIYTSNSISIEVAKIGLPQGFVLIHINKKENIMQGNKTTTL